MSQIATIPADFPAGWQAVESGLVESGDILVAYNGSKEWAETAVGFHVADMLGDPPSPTSYWRAVYRKMPCPVNLDKLPEIVPMPGSSSPVLPVTSSDARDPLPDTGQRAQYATGAVRDASKGKGHFHSIPPCARRAIAKRFEDGAQKYSKDNWMKGIPLSHYVDSLSRHQIGIETGDTSEDHYGALLWNAAAMMWTDEEIKAGRLPKELDDLPYRPR